MPDRAPEADAMTVQDAYHTMTELYEQRALYHALYVNLMEFVDDGSEASADKSWLHHDGEPPFGNTEPGERWFIVTMYLPNGAQVTQHYPENLWDAFHIPTVDTADVWDGHNAAEGNSRMRKFLGLSETENDD